MWTIICQPDSENFFHEVHNRFQDAQNQIRNSPTGLVIMENEGTTNLVVIQDRKTATGTITSMDIQVCAVIMLMLMHNTSTCISNIKLEYMSMCISYWHLFSSP